MTVDEAVAQIEPTGSKSVAVEMGDGGMVVTASTAKGMAEDGAESKTETTKVNIDEVGKKAKAAGADTQGQNDANEKLQAAGRRLPSGNQSATAIVKVAPKVGSTLPTFSAPPIDETILSNLNDSDLLLAAKNACSIHAQAGAYAKEFLAELKRRFDEGKKLRKPYLGYKNFDKLCADRLEIGARQVRNILNNNPSGKKGRVVKPRPTLRDLENVKTENKRLKAHAKMVEDANDRIAAGHEHLAAGYTKQDLEQAKKDAVRDHQKIAAKEKAQSENEIGDLEDSVRKLTKENRKLQKESKQSRSKPSTTKLGSRSLVTDSKTPTREEVVCQTVAMIKPFSLSDRRLIIDEIEARLRHESTRNAGDGSKHVIVREGDQNARSN